MKFSCQKGKRRRRRFLASKIHPNACSIHTDIRSLLLLLHSSRKRAHQTGSSNNITKGIRSDFVYENSKAFPSAREILRGWKRVIDFCPPLLTLAEVLCSTQTSSSSSATASCFTGWSPGVFFDTKKHRTLQKERIRSFHTLSPLNSLSWPSPDPVPGWRRSLVVTRNSQMTNPNNSFCTSCFCWGYSWFSSVTEDFVFYLSFFCKFTSVPSERTTTAPLSLPNYSRVFPVI